MKLVTKRSPVTPQIQGWDNFIGKTQTPVGKPVKKRGQSSQQGIRETADLSLGSPPSTTPAVAYFKLRKQLRKQRPALLDPQSIRLQPLIAPTASGVKYKRQVSVTLTTTATTVLTSITIVSVSPSAVTKTEVFIPPVLSTIPAIATTIVGPNGNSITVTLRPPITTTLVPAETIELPNPVGGVQMTAVLTEPTGSDMTDSTPQPTAPFPRPSSSSGSSSPSPGSPIEPQSRLSANHVPVIVGGTIGSVIALFILILAIFLFCRRRSRRREALPVLLPDPFPAERRAPLFSPQTAQFTSASSPFENMVSANVSASPAPTNQLSSQKSDLRQDMTRSQSTGIQSQENIRPQERIAGTPSPPPVSQHSATSELQGLRQRIEEIEELTRRRFREADAALAVPIVAPQARAGGRASESPPEYASPIEAGNRG